MREIVEDYNYRDADEFENRSIYQKAEKEETENKLKKCYRGTPLLLLLQIFVCVIILGALILFKTFGGAAYDNFKIWYLEKANESLIAGNNIEDYKEAISGLVSRNVDVSELPEELSRHAVVTCSLSSTPVALSSPLSPPLSNGIITSAFGNREDPFSGEKSVHYGIDIGADEGEQIFAVLPGVVKEVGENTSYGKYVLLDHGDDISSRYAHCSELIVKNGEEVKRGQCVALVGSTGYATGNHLHLEFLIGQEKYDPQPLLKGIYI